MSSTIAARLVSRQAAPFRTSLRASRRYASTTEKATEKVSEAASKAKDTASNVQSKASEGLSKVQSSAGSAASSAASRVSSAASSVTGRVGKLFGAIESMIPRVVYYGRVGLELGKLVAQGQKISIPSGQQFSNAFQPLINAFRNPSAIMQSAERSAANTSPESVLSRVRNMDKAQWATAGVLFAEVLGFFTVGEMLGRLKLVGYHGETHHGH